MTSSDLSQTSATGSPHWLSQFYQRAFRDRSRDPHKDIWIVDETPAIIDHNGRPVSRPTPIKLAARGEPSRDSREIDAFRTSVEGDVQKRYLAVIEALNGSRNVIVDLRGEDQEAVLEVMRLHLGFSERSRQAVMMAAALHDLSALPRSRGKAELSPYDIGNIAVFAAFGAPLDEATGRRVPPLQHDLRKIPFRAVRFPEWLPIFTADSPVLQYSPHPRTRENFAKGFYYLFKDTEILFPLSTSWMLVGSMATDSLGAPALSRSDPRNHLGTMLMNLEGQLYCGSRRHAEWLVRHRQTFRAEGARIPAAQLTAIFDELRTP